MESLPDNDEILSPNANTRETAADKLVTVLTRLGTPRALELKKVVERDGATVSVRDMVQRLLNARQEGARRRTRRRLGRRKRSRTVGYKGR
jgi:hypothetical protein